MKVDFTDTATLNITPENSIENYALKKWYEAYTDTTRRNMEALHVNLFAEDPRVPPDRAPGAACCGQYREERRDN